jgi:large subunit ribosomal protein L15
MSLHNLKAPKGSRRGKKRVGRGQGSGWGKTAGRGGKGQTARTGNMNLSGFEGGQMPLTRRMPKFGFQNHFRKDIAVVNVADLDRFTAGATVDAAALAEAGLVKGRHDGLKILGDGDLTKKLVVKADAFSKQAKDKIVKAGGSAEVVVAVPRPAQSPAAAPAKA